MKIFDKIAFFTQISTSILSVLWIMYIPLLIISLSFIADPGNIYHPQLGDDTLTRFMLYLVQHPELIILAILNIIYSSLRGFEKSKKHLGI